MNFLTASATIFGHVRSINGSIKFSESQPYMVSHVTRTLKTLKTKKSNTFFQWNQSQRLYNIVIKNL